MLNATSQSELEHNSKLARRSPTILAELYDELVDRDSIHCLPSECFGSPTPPDQTNTQNTRGFEPSQGSEIQMARVYSSVTTGAEMVHFANIPWMTTKLPSSEAPTPATSRQTQNSDSTRIFTQDGIVNEGGFGLEHGSLPNTFWASEGIIKSCDNISRFSDPAADEPSSGISETTAPTPSTLPSLDVLLSPGSAKLAEESIQGPLDVTDGNLETWVNMLW